MFEPAFGVRRFAWRRMGATTIAWMLLIGANAAGAQPGQNKEPWSGQKYDRAAMAVIMHQADTGAGASSSSIDASSTTLVCGGPAGTASASANSSCIIINKGSAQISTGQASDGTQTAQSNATSVSTSDASSMSSALAGLVPGN